MILMMKFRSIFGEEEVKGPYSLSEINDEFGFTFDDIADLIEEQL